MPVPAGCASLTRIGVFFVFVLVLTNSCLHGRQLDAPADVDRLVAQLTSEDPKTADQAKRELEGMGTRIVPVLFHKLLVADWTLRPRLLEVLSAQGSEFAKQKLKDGTDTEKIYAALVYELSVACSAEDFEYDAPEFAAMVEALLKAIKNEDKYLRAAAGAALVYDEESTAWFRHFHEIVPALISSFDTDLIIDRCNRGGPVEIVLIVICYNLTALIGDRVIDAEELLFAGPPDSSPQEGLNARAVIGKRLADKRSEVDRLRTSWQTWWKDHSNLTAVEIGVLMIERNLGILAAKSSSKDDWSIMTANWSLEKWTGTCEASEEWGDWWKRKRATYDGPTDRRK